MSTQEFFAITNNSDQIIIAKSLNPKSSSKAVINPDSTAYFTVDTTPVNGHLLNITPNQTIDNNDPVATISMQYLNGGQIITIKFYINGYFRIKNNLNTNRFKDQGIQNNNYIIIQQIAKIVTGETSTSTLDYDKTEIILTDGANPQEGSFIVDYSISLSIEGDDFNTIVIEGVHCAD